MLENIFETGKGIYQLDTETGLFTLKGQPSTPKRFLGSVDPQWEVYYGTRYVLGSVISGARVQMVLTSFLDSHAEGFTPSFREGYFPFGIVCAPEDIILVGEGRVVFSDKFRERVDKDRNIKIQLASEIERVYRQLQDQERGYKVVR